MIGYKLFRVRRDGTIGPLFINRKQVITPGVWLSSEDHPTHGYAHRPGWHATTKPYAPHLVTNLASGERRAWYKVELERTAVYNRPESQGGTWVLAGQMKVLEEVKEEVQ